MSDENNNQTVGEETVPLTAAKSSGGVFSWLTGSRSPTYGTTTSASAGDTTITTTTTATSTGSRSGSVSPAGTASPASGTRSPARSSSPPRSPSRFVIPNIAAGFGGGGGRFGPAVMMDLGARTVYTHTTEEPTTTTTTTSSTTMEDEQQQRESELPPSVVITTKTLGEPQLKTVKSVTSTTSSSDNQLMEPVLGANVQYVTTTETSAAGEPHRVVRYTTTSSTGGTPVASPMGASSSNVRYVTSSTSGAVPVDGQEHHHHDGGVRYITRTVNNTTHTPVASPVAMAGGATSVRYVTSSAPMTTTVVDGEGHNEGGSGVRYVTRTVTGSGSNAGSTSHTPVASPVAIGAGATSVRYVTTVGASPIGASGMHGGATTNVRFFPPQVQPPQVHTVTRVVNGQQVQVPMPVGGEPHHHNVQYITRSASPAMSTHSSVSSSSGSMLASPVGAVEQRQQVRYITKTMGHAAAAPLSGQGQRQVQQSSTTTQAVGGSGLGGGAVGGNGAAMTSTTGSTSVSGGVPLRTVVASTLLNQDPNHTGVELAEEVEGLPVHFIGIQRTVTDTDSSDGEEHEVKMVFDIMSQTFKPAGKRRSRRSTAAAAAAGAGAGAAAGAAIGAAAEGGAAGEAAGAAGAGGAGGAAGAGAMAASGAIAGAAVAAEAEAEAYAEADAGADAGANAGAGAYAGAGAIAAAGAAVAIQAEADAELEGKAAVAAGALEAEAEADADANGKKNGSGLATAAAIGLAAAVGVGAAVAVNAAGKTPSSPMMKLDTVAPAGPADALASTPGGPKKRTPSQSKAEPSPRQFFSEVPSTTASAAANKEQILPDETVTMDIDPQTQYAELRSPSHNGGARLNHVGLLLKVRKCRWLLITLISLAIIVFLTAIFYKGVTLKKFQSSRYSLSRQYDMADNYNSYLALFTALFGKPIEMLVAIVLPILFITIVDKSLLATKLSSCLMIVLFIIGFLVSYLLCSAFHGINVQLRVQSATPIISLADMSLSLAGAASYAASGASALLIAAAAANASSNASVVVSETGAKNAITNTVLRNVVDLTVEPSTASPLCSNTVDYSNVLGANVPNLLSSVWTTTTTTYGFPMRSWQQEMLPGAVAESNYTLKLSDTTTTTLLNGVVLPMRLRTAANLFLHGVHVARDAFRWFGATSTPLGVQAAVDAKYGSATDGKLTHVFVSDLLGLTNTSTTNNVVDDVVSTPAFLNQVRSLFNRSLTGAANISRVESSLEFTSVSLPNGYAFESVTMEIPLVASFLSRRLTLSGNTFVEDTPDANETDIYYDLDIATDCGPYSGACEVRRTEYDASGNVFEPVTTVRALSLCNNSVGTDDLEVFFDGSVAKKNIAYTCDGQVDSGMLVVSVSSRIVGDALIEGPSTLLPRLVEGQATLKNARKIYSLTVGKLSWPKTNLATTFHAACAAGVGKCNGLQYALTAALKNSTVSVTTSGSLRGSVTTTEEDSGDNQYLVVGNDYLPLNQLSGFSYNTTEAATQTAKTTQAVSGFPLVTITKPVEADSLFENDGDVVVAANFKTVSWTQARRGVSCSATVESRLNSVLNNHQYIERGVQPAYTAGMFFLFQDAVAKAQIALSLSGGASVTTLQFANTVEFVALVASIPLLSAVLTFIGCAIILLVSIYVLLMSRPKLYAIDSNGHEGDEEGTSGHVAQETLARVKLNQLLFPPVVLHRRVVDLTNSSHSTTTGTTALSPGGSKTPQSSGGYASLEGEEVDSFEVKGMQMEHENRDVSVDMAK